MANKMLKWPVNGPEVDPDARADIKLRNGNVLQNHKIADVISWNSDVPEGEAKLDVAEYQLLGDA